MKRRDWRAHVAIDLGAMILISALAALGLISGDAAFAGILVIQGAYVLQMRRPPPGGPGAILVAFDAMEAIVRRL